MRDIHDCKKAYFEFCSLIKERDKKLDRIEDKEFKNRNQLLDMIQEYNKANNVLVSHYNEYQSHIADYIKQVSK